MAVIVSLPATNALGTYAELVAEVRDLADNDAYDENVIKRAIRKAEAYFVRELDARETSTIISIALTGATVVLPLDCNDVIEVIDDNETPLQAMTTQGLSERYSGIEGTPAAYAVEGDTLRFAPVGVATVRLRYYKGFVPLSENRPSNWLLTRHPDLYVAGTMYYLALRERDGEGAATFLNLVNQVLASVKADEGRRMSVGIVPTGIKQVPGCRV